MDVVVVGAGAAGLLAAAFAAGEGRRVVLLERTRDGGRKILISGGGRCNILPSEVEPEWFVTDSSPHSLRNILRGWPLQAQRRFFEEELRLPLALEEESGKLFPASNRARDVRDRLLEHARARGAEVRFGSALTGLAATGRGVAARPRGWRVTPGASRWWWRPAGSACRPPAATARDSGWRSDWGIVMHPTYPALTPLTTTAARWTALSGVSLDAQLTAPPETPDYNRRQGLLFTHRGFSGPAVLNISHVFTRPRDGEPPAMLAQLGRPRSRRLGAGPQRGWPRPPGHRDPPAPAGAARAGAPGRSGGAGGATAGPTAARGAGGGAGRADGASAARHRATRATGRRK